MTELRKIFYVEDQEDIQMVARVALEAIGGYEVRICSSGEQALEEVEAFEPDIILLDVMMPGMDGPSTLLEMKKISALDNIPVAFMTAKIQPSEVSEYIALGAVDVISKPFDPMTLSDQVMKIWQAHCNT
ncbi:MAG: response regulator [Gammaproteobacteria bacterium]|nr:response regulator [Gammaproteobacteria bacterium]